VQVGVGYIRTMPSSNFRILTYGRLSAEFKYFVDHNYPELDCLRCDSRQELQQLVPTVDALAGFDFTRNLQLSHIRWFHSFAAGVDSLIGRRFSPECVITRTSGQLGPRIGEYCLAYILYDLKGVDRVLRQKKDLKWRQFDLSSIREQKVMVLGTGTIGAGIAKILKPLCKVLVGVSRSGSMVEPFDRVFQLETLGDSLDFDVVINALPLTEHTRERINVSFFRRFSRVHYINVGRGATNSEPDLINALNEGNVRRAVLDVFSTEPLPDSSMLWTHPDIIITPHHSGLTTIEDVKESFIEVYPLVGSGTKNV
jgi:phosphoglycerate dehydrogenase-like enzyme